MKRPSLPALPLDRQKIAEILRPADAGQQARQKRRVMRSFLSTVRRAASAIPFTRDLAASYYCAIDPETPLASRGILLAALAYFVMPADLVPDLMPLIGFTDDAAVLMAAITAVRANIRPEHYDRARALLDSETDEADARTP
ncbi:YkvA family protein [Aureimonas altamirensis]|uniref:YkvA family protein n=1 Tax=Aureimonas altamirensis TaxID=370622 RepID=UPI0025532B6C|nr:YkvA family protein [Aureimonas altamirensis]